MGRVEPITVAKPAAASLEIVATEGSTLVLPPGMASTPAAAAAAAAAAGSADENESANVNRGAFADGKAAAAVDELAAAMSTANMKPAPAAGGVAPPRAATTDATGAPLKTCGFCHEGIRSAFVMAKGQAFHPNHFQVG